MENKWKNENFFVALKNAFNGIKYVFINERNFRIQLILAIIVIIIAFFLKLKFVQLAILVLTIFLVLFAELINTALEVIVDMYTKEYNEKAKIAKDISSGAVTLIAIMSVIIGLMVFLPTILEIYNNINNI